jgi:hypothetical protein
MPGERGRRSRDSVRDGTTNLEAALDVDLGDAPRHRSEELRRFPDLIDASVPADDN